MPTGVDGELWSHVGASLRRLTDLGAGERSARAPVVHRGLEPFVVYVVDEREVWKLDIRPGSVPVRLDDGSHEFCFDPAIAPRCVRPRCDWR